MHVLGRLDRTQDAVDRVGEGTIQEVLELGVLVGAQTRIPARLIAQKVPDDVVKQRRERLEEEAEDKGQPVSPEQWELAQWTIVITNVPTSRLSLPEALVLMRLRWQIAGREELIETAYSLLFLARGRHPIIMNKLRFAGSWANRPRDLANLSRWAFLLTFAGVGLRTNLRELSKQGWRPLAVGVVGEFAIAVLTLAMVVGAARRFVF